MKNKITLLGFFGILAIVISFAFKPFNDKKIIVIDAGHGGKDFGATIGELTEKKIVESIANKIKELNKNDEIEIVLLREEDRFMELSERVLKINTINPSLLISLHINNSENLNENGVNAYISKQNEFYDISVEKAKNLINKISGKNLMQGEVKDANFYIIKNSKCPALILEIGYLSNEENKKYIASEKGQDEIAKKIFNFLKN